MPNEEAGTDKRRNLTTAMRRAIWEAHGRKCAYTGELIDWNELEIDHIIPVKGDPKQKQELLDSGVIDSNFDINGFDNLLPIKSWRNNKKSNFIPNQSSIVYFLSIAAQAASKAEKMYNSLISSDRGFNSYLQIKSQAEQNDIGVEDLIGYLRHQADGEVPLRISLEIEGKNISSANSQYATVLMDKPFALGGGSITDVVLQTDGGEPIVCRTASEFLVAKDAGAWPLTQYDINCYSLAEQTSELLRAVKESSYASISEIRTPHIDFECLEKWSSSWLADMLEENEIDLSKYPDIQSLINSNFVQPDEHTKWSVTFHRDGEFSVRLSELMRADLDNDNNEEILVFSSTFAREGTFQAGKVYKAKVGVDGLLAPAEHQGKVST